MAVTLLLSAANSDSGAFLHWQYETCKPYACCQSIELHTSESVMLVYALTYCR